MLHVLVLIYKLVEFTANLLADGFQSFILLHLATGISERSINKRVKLCLWAYLLEDGWRARGIADVIVVKLDDKPEIVTNSTSCPEKNPNFHSSMLNLYDGLPMNQYGSFALFVFECQDWIYILLSPSYSRYPCLHSEFLRLKMSGGIPWKCSALAQSKMKITNSTKSRQYIPQRREFHALAARCRGAFFANG